MKHLLISLVLAFFSLISLSQTPSEQNAKMLDSLVQWVSENIQSKVKDSAQVYSKALRAAKLAKENNNKTQLAISYRNLATWHLGSESKDSTKFYLKKAEGIFKTLGSDNLLAETYLTREEVFKENADYSQAMEFDYKALALFEKTNNQRGIANCYTRICDLLYFQEKNAEGALYCQKAIDIQMQIDVPEELAISYRYKADNLLMLERYEEALVNINESISVLRMVGKPERELIPAFNTRGNIFKHLKRYDEALLEYKKNYTLSKKENNERGIYTSLGNIGHVHRIQENYQEALLYTLEAIDAMKKYGNTQNLLENYMHAADSYLALGNYKDAYDYNELFHQEKSRSKDQIIEQLESELQIKYETAKKDETIEEQDVKIAQQRKNQILYMSIAGLLALILFGMYFTLKNIHKKRKKLAELNGELERRRKDLEDSNKALKKSLQNLKVTQTQLIQSEKMASLGELTAGIAHEIQNPLNFVNNFSEVSNELIDEMNEEIDKGDIEEAKIIAIDIKQNLEKINRHGKRADAIVKGMLQHSRKSTGIKEPTDINILTDEYLRIAYHGLRAKDKSFNSKMETDFGENIGLINIIPQDIGRVILNLITNAFYVVDQKKKQQPKVYDPSVSVITQKIDKNVVITVKDNGNGIPKEVLDKIFQPFFTTKPTGEGTGLGLSLSYDIIKAHRGELKVETKEGIGTSFRIIIPVE
jgi:two-component system NtrC family sensor kinase